VPQLSPRHGYPGENDLSRLILLGMTIGSGMAQREPVARIEASLPVNGQDCARTRHSPGAHRRRLNTVHDSLDSDSVPYGRCPPAFP